jgi:hypothetical protein
MGPLSLMIIQIERGVHDAKVDSQQNPGKRIFQMVKDILIFFNYLTLM